MACRGKRGEYYDMPTSKIGPTNNPFVLQILQELN
jgi:hypothetical protein